MKDDVISQDQKKNVIERLKLRLKALKMFKNLQQVTGYGILYKLLLKPMREVV